jgi:galacturonosyltransferase
MKILIAANNDVGLYKFRKELIESFLKRKDQVFISLPDGDLVRPLESMGCQFLPTEIDRRGMNPWKDLQLLLFYRKLLKKIRPDLVITYTIKPNLYCGMACRWAKIDYACNITGLGTAFQNEGIFRKMIVLLYRYACKNAKTVFFENKGNAITMRKYGIVTKKQTVLLSGAGVNLEDYPFSQYPNTTNGYHFLFIGRVMREKGIDELFEAAKMLRKERQDVFFDIVGPFEDDYKDTIKALKEEQIIRYFGYQEDVRPFIRKCHCFVLPSWHEGMANTLLEAAAMGRPLITSRIHGCMEAVEEGRSGLLVPVQNAEELYLAMKHFLTLSDDEKRTFGQRSRLRMEKIFDKKKVVAKTIKNLT